MVDTIKDNFNGFLVNDIRGFKEKILYIVNNEDLFFKNSREFAENFTWERTVHLWCELLSDRILK